MPKFPPLVHVAVTVSDLERSTRWYTELPGAGPAQTTPVGG
jgi:glyoxylase I family protein